ncbi:MAG TPA: GNAT family N-acetyltransferase [Acetobacteraceae bacterium]|nr:GNAT family N-acetyltransferase [Acetobacteraceae bacterium]
MPDPCVRPGRDSDAAGFIALIGACWAEYPDVIFDIDGEVPELRALATHYAGKGGMLWAAEAKGGEVVGMVATLPAKAEADAASCWEIARMYVARPWRGTGLAHRLLDRAESHARAQGARRAVLWSDTRFRPAHRFYEKRSYVRVGPLRVLNDLSRTLEFGFTKPLAGVVAQPLGAAATASAARSLATIPPAAAPDEPVSQANSAAHWRRVAAEIAAGSRILVAAWNEGVIAGSVEIALPPPETGPAFLERLIVPSGSGDSDVGRALLMAAAAAARDAGRSVLAAMIRDGGRSADLLRGNGWESGAPSPFGLWWRALART